MASGKRQPSKQKRTNQNRQERAARQARTTNASGAPARPAASSAAGRSGGGSLLGRLRGAAATPPASAAKRPAAGSGRLASSPLADPSLRPVGYRAALTGLLAAVAAVVVTIFLHTPVDAQGELYTKPAIAADWAATALHEAQEQPDADAAEVVTAIDDWMPGRGSERLFVGYFPASLLVLLPVLGAFLCFRAVSQRKSAKVVTRTMYATLLGAFLTLSLLQFFLPTVIAVSVAGFQVRKREVEAARAAAAEGGDGVIEADVIEADVVEAEVVEAEVVDADDSADEKS